MEQAKDKLAALHNEQAKTREQQRKEGKDATTSVDDRKALKVIDQYTLVHTCTRRYAFIHTYITINLYI